MSSANVITFCPLVFGVASASKPFFAFCNVDGISPPSEVDDSSSFTSLSVDPAAVTDDSASAASAAIDHMKDWELGSSVNDWVSMAVPSDGSYGISQGIIFSYPITCKDGKYSIVQDLDIDEFSLQSIKASEEELLEEREAIKHLL